MLIVSEKSNFTPTPMGLHTAVCTGVIGLGVQQTPYGNKPQVLFIWELEALMDDGRRFSLSRKFSPSLSKKATLRTFLESWRGRAFTTEELKGFELKKILGKPCQLMIQHTPSADGSRTYANISAVVPAPKGVDITPQADLLYYDPDDPDEEVYGKMPEWLRKLIDSAILSQPVTATPATTESRDFNDDLTF